MVEILFSLSVWGESTEGRRGVPWKIVKIKTPNCYKISANCFTFQYLTPLHSRESNTFAILVNQKHIVGAFSV
jgi:hypothetical protein